MNLEYIYIIIYYFKFRIGHLQLQGWWAGSGSTVQLFLSTMILQDAGISGECFQKVECPASDPVSGNAFDCVNTLSGLDLGI